jgi:hypothetical protein
MNWLLYTKATAAAADCAAASGPSEPPPTRSATTAPATGSRPDHPLHPAYIAKNEAASAWFAEKRDSAAAAA